MRKISGDAREAIDCYRVGKILAQLNRQRRMGRNERFLSPIGLRNSRR
jgi:hypothetical protein